MDSARQLLEHKKICDNKDDIFITLDLSKIPLHVSSVDIQVNGCLLNQDQMNRINQILGEDKTNSVRFSKRDPILKNISPYGMIKQDNTLYAVYKGSHWKKELGEGGFAKVKLVQNLETKEWFALRVPKKNKQGLDSIKVEFEKLSQVNMQVGTDIITRKEIDRTLKRKKESSSANFNMMMKYIPGKNILEFIEKKNLILSEQECYEIAKGVVTAIVHLHQLGKIHRDIKLENFIYDPNTGKVSLIDIGSMVDIPKDESKPYVLIEERNVTEKYLSPEAKNEHQFSVQSDIFALGLSLKELFGMIAIDDKRTQYVKTSLDEEKLKELWELFSSMTLKQPPEKRASLAEINHALNSFKPKNPQVKVLAIIELDKLDVNNINYNLLRRNINEIVFVNQKGMPINYKKLLSARQQFESHGINVRNEVLTTNDVNNVPEKINALDKGYDKNVNHDYYHYINKGIEKVKQVLTYSHGNLVSHKDIKKIKRQILDEKNRLDEKYKNTSEYKNPDLQARYKKLSEFSNFLDKQITYYRLFEKMTEIQPYFLKTQSYLPTALANSSMFKRKTEFYKVLESSQSLLKKTFN